MKSKIVFEEHINLKEELDKEMTQEEFLQWIDDAEKSPTMSLETFNERWNFEMKKLRLKYSL